MHVFESNGLPMNLFETQDDLVVIAATPGIEPEDIRVRLEDHHLHIETVERGEDASRKYVLREWSYGPYIRSIEIPWTIDGSRANITYGNGVLTIVLPKDAEFTDARLEVPKVGQARGALKGKAARSGSAI